MKNRPKKSRTDIQRLEWSIAALFFLALGPYLILLNLDIKSIFTVMMGMMSLALLFVAFRLMDKRLYLKLIEFDHKGDIELDDQPHALALTLLTPISDATKDRIFRLAEVYCLRVKKPMDIHYSTRAYVRANKERALFDRLHELSNPINECLPAPMIKGLTDLHAHYQSHPEFGYCRSEFYHRDIQLLADVLENQDACMSSKTAAKIEHAMVKLNRKFIAVQLHINQNKEEKVRISTDVINADKAY